MLPDVAALRESAETLGALVEASPFAIIGLNPDATVLIWNRVAQETFGYAPEEVMGRPYPLVPEDGQAEFDRLFARAKAGEQLRNVAMRRCRKDGSLIDVSVSGAPLYDRKGGLRGVIYALEDVTERKALEEKLRHAQKMEAIGQLTGGVAHDFNNLLSVVIMNLDLLSERLGEEGDAHELLDAAQGAALRGSELTQRLLAFSRRQPLQPVDLDLNATLPNLVAMLRRTLGATIDVYTAPGADLAPAYVDPSQLENAVLNLAINARDAMPRGGRLLIETCNATLSPEYAAAHVEVAPGDYVMLSVTDTGEGMSPELVARVFEPFFTTKDAGRGTGLGLSMVYGFVKQSNGHVKIYSEPGHGTSVKLYLPPSQAARPSAEAQSKREPVVGGEETVLVVEDDPTVRQGAVKLLAELGYRTREAEDGPKALELLAGEPDIELVFTDIVMPGGLNGYELVREIRRRSPDMPVLYTSGYSESFMNLGGEGDPRGQLLMKPYRKRNLARAIRTALDGGAN